MKNPFYKQSTTKSTLSKMFKREDYAEIIRVASFLGMSTEHSIFMDVETMVYTYITVPQSGSYEGLKRAAKKEQRLMTWTPRKNTKNPLAQMETWSAACTYAQIAAFTEVAREQDLELPESFWTGVPSTESITGYTEEELTKMEAENAPSFIEIRGAGLRKGDVMVLPFGKTATVTSARGGRLYMNFGTEFGSGRVGLTDPVQIQPRA